MTLGNILVTALVAEIGLIFAMPTDFNHALAMGLVDLTIATWVAMIICLIRGRA